MVALKEALSGLKLVDLGRGMSAAIAAKLMADLGATAQRFESTAGDPFYSIYPAYSVWHAGARRQLIESLDHAQVQAALATADVCILGGEDFPGNAWSLDAEAIALRYPNLVLLEIEAYPKDSDAAGRPAVELLVQARSGMSFEQYSRRPIQLSFSPGSYGAAVNGLIGVFAALCRRERGGVGQIVRVSLYEGLMMLAAGNWFTATKPSGAFKFSSPKDPHPLIFKCRDGRYVHFVLGSFGSKGQSYRILGIDDPTVSLEDSGVPTGRGDPKNFYGDVDLLAAHVAMFDSVDLLEQLHAAGIAASYVHAPGECWDDVQVRHADIIATDAQGCRHVGLPMHGALAPWDASRSVLSDAASGALPLAGIRAIDFGIFVAGPFGSTPLADLGADVVKVEPLRGDVTRGMVRTFASANRGKRSIAIDMKMPEGISIAAQLCASAQIIHSNFRPGVSARLGVDPKTQHAIDPDKIVLEANGWGRSGPNGDRPGFDMIFQAFCGHEVRGGGAGNAPMCDRSVMVDFFAGALGSLATLVAVWRRFRGAGGADLELSLLDSGLFLLSELIQTPDGEFIGAPPLNSAQSGYHPAEALYACADGWIALAARGEAVSSALAQELGFSAGPRDRWSEIEAMAISKALAALTVNDALKKLEGAGVWAERCETSGDAMLDREEGISANLVLASEHPVWGTVKQIGALFRLGDRRHTAPRSAPPLGADTRDLLSELGYSDEAIEQLYARKIVA